MAVFMCAALNFQVFEHSPMAHHGTERASVCKAGNWADGERGLAALQRPDDFEQSLRVTAEYAERPSSG